MATISRDDIVEALRRLGQVALEHGEHVELLLVGGALMALQYGARNATRDVDVIIRLPNAEQVRRFAHCIALERGWPSDWLNDAAKGYLAGTSKENIVFKAPGIVVYAPSTAQMLAMKLTAWRDDLDISDARCLLHEMPGTRQEIWDQVVPHLVRGSELKAQYAFEDLWESSRESN